MISRLICLMMILRSLKFILFIESRLDFTPGGGGKQGMLVQKSPAVRRGFKLVLFNVLHLGVSLVVRDLFLHLNQ